MFCCLSVSAVSSLYPSQECLVSILFIRSLWGDGTYMSTALRNDTVAVSVPTLRYVAARVWRFVRLAFRCLRTPRKYQDPFGSGR